MTLRTKRLAAALLKAWPCVAAGLSSAEGADKKAFTPLSDGMLPKRLNGGRIDATPGTLHAAAPNVNSKRNFQVSTFDVEFRTPPRHIARREDHGSRGFMCHRHGNLHPRRNVWLVQQRVLTDR